MVRGRATFGFTNVNGRAFKVKIVNAPRGKFLGRLAIPTMRQEIVTRMNKYGRKAERTAKGRRFSPFLTGALVASIRWESAKRSGFTGLIIGSLTVGVPYGRRQEFEHLTRGFYLHRAIQKWIPAFQKELSDIGVIESIVFGTRKQIGGGGARGGFF